MKKLLAFLFLSSLTTSVFAAKLEDVKILDTILSEGHLKLKLQEKGTPADSFFYVDISKDDEDAFRKLSFVIAKQRDEKLVQLDLDIPSFSSYPSGSSYRSHYVDFSGRINVELLPETQKSKLEELEKNGLNLK